MYYEWYHANRRRVVVIGSILFALIIIWSVYTYVSRIGKTAVTINAVPSNSTVLANNTSVGSGTVWLTPGEYTVKGSKDGFSTREKKITVDEEKRDNVVALALTPESDEAKRWAEKNQRQYKDNEEFGAIEAQANGEQFRQNNPVVAKLPYDDPYYQINYITENDDVIITITTPSPRYRYYAVQKFRELGFDPARFIMRFTDFKNPLGGVSNE
ncbi:hypothetical protein A2707_04315 [Candidatus Saccharibacteria bacterium RIFCSPHIGHO2_01_FULL_45_15]|nr:MAG: hypothetical protein A2707_04315 [Candidatus Saccharibacteria bacterium RIFCSPHIGHO2_01_FULL_45_15]OGL27164.1 MAG: hypothetical protein A3C39_01210 [Candidatus Saccharibacteria bacterium RIFCSPHIGHO2_02_FULL_46_12]OGL32796.1 MAG: hypothetical protein A3E76_05645 [Candidatus Saccharibacteria bacterium RIFCSPHIGHO2_12_FULL_44_22]